MVVVWSKFEVLHFSSEMIKLYYLILSLMFQVLKPATFIIQKNDNPYNNNNNNFF